MNDLIGRNVPQHLIEEIRQGNAGPYGRVLFTSGDADIIGDMGHR